MDDIVRLKPKSSYATLSAALALTSGRRVALVFPLGEPTCLHDTALLDTLRSRCHLLGKEVIIIGADAWLRAHAVAAGFHAATTLEDWGDTAPEHHSMRPPQTGQPARQVRQPRAASSPRLWLVTSRYADTRASDERDIWVSEPPEYVIEIREAFSDRSPVTRPPIISLPLLSIAPDENDDDHDDHITASERFEEKMVGRILETSGIHHLEIPGAL
jgi:hypothetical protein